MAKTAKNHVNDGGQHFPPEAYEYNDDVSKETVAKIREERGIDVSDDKWKVIDSLGQVVPA